MHCICTISALRSWYMQGYTICVDREIGCSAPRSRLSSLGTAWKKVLGRETLSNYKCCNHDLSGSCHNADMNDIVYICKLNQIRIFVKFYPDIGLYIFHFVYRVHAQFYDKNNQITTLWHLR